jgi:hypothetical protein
VSQPIAVVASDLHVEYHAYAAYPAMWGDSYHALQQVVDACLQYHVPPVLPGDLFDKAYPDSYSLKQFFQQLDRLQQARLTCLYTQGQHELSRRQPWLSLHANPYHLHGVVARLGSHGFYGLDFQPADRLAEQIALIPPEADVLVCHQVWGEFMGKHSAPEGWLAELIPPQIKLVLTGDFHAHTRLQVTSRRPQAPHSFTVLSPGSTTLQSVSEDPIKYVYLLHDDLSMRSLRLLGRQVYYSQIADEVQLDAELDRVLTLLTSTDFSHLPENLRTPMWVANCLETLGADATRRLRVAAHNQLHLFLRIFSGQTLAEEATPAPEPALDLSTLEKAMSHVGPALGAPPDSPVYALVLRLLRSNDPKSELRTFIDEALKEDLKEETSCGAPTDLSALPGP